MVQGKITEADTLTIHLGATPSGLISDPPPSSPIFMPDALPAAALPLYPDLGQAPNMLACIPSGMVSVDIECTVKLSIKHSLHLSKHKYCMQLCSVINFYLGSEQYSRTVFSIQQNLFFFVLLDIVAYF